jgi:hypothetical protein
MSARRAKLSSMAAESTAVVLTERIDSLAAALRAAGVSPERSSSLLTAAATATMHAVTLQALLDEQPWTPVAAEPPAAIATSRPERVSLAA